MLALVDTHILVYRFDPRDARKQRVTTQVLRHGLSHGTLRIPHQAIVEFVAATTRPIGGGAALLSAEDARREAEELMGQFEVLYPNAPSYGSADRLV